MYIDYLAVGAPSDKSKLMQFDTLKFGEVANVSLVNNFRVMF